MFGSVNLCNINLKQIQSYIKVTTKTTFQQVSDGDKNVTQMDKTYALTRAYRM